MPREATGSSGLTRRSALRRTAGSLAVVGLGSSGAAAATATEPGYSDEAIAAAESYLSTDAVRAALQAHASDALNEAVAEGVLDTADTAALPVDALHDTPADWAASSEGATVFTEERDGRPSPKVEVKQSLGDGRTFRLAVHPADGESQWTVQDDADTTACGCQLDQNCTYVCVGGTCEARWLYCCCDHTCDSGSRCSSPVNCGCQDICGSRC